MNIASVAALAMLLGGCGGASQSAPVLQIARPARQAVTTASAMPAESSALPAGSRGAAPRATAAGTPEAGTPEAGTPEAGTPEAGTPPVSAPAAPPIVWDPIPFGEVRKEQMRSYAERHYGIDSYELREPRVIVIHYTETPDFQSTFNVFAPDTPDPELHELPNTCAHFVIDAEGVIHQLVPLNIMCRHTVGLNWTAIGIEHVGYSDRQVLENSRQLKASLRLVRWLSCRFHISIGDVIGHNESLSSPYHHENVPALRSQTHSDFNRADMQIYRRRLAALGGCPGG